VDVDHEERSGRRLVAVLLEPLNERLDSGVLGGRGSTTSPAPSARTHHNRRQSSS
jgi:hypothetical protein